MMFCWKRKLKPVNPTQELASKIIGALNAEKNSSHSCRNLQQQQISFSAVRFPSKENARHPGAGWTSGDSSKGI